MQITKQARFTTDFYGSAPAIGDLNVLLNWIDKVRADELLSFIEKVKKKSEEAEYALERILSIFHRDEKGYPVLGSWMLRKCLMVTGTIIFNPITNKDHPKRATVAAAISLVEPYKMNVYDGKIIKKPDKVETYTVTKGNRSFFKAYEAIKAGATFEATMYFDNELLTDEHIQALLDNCGKIGVGAFRERFGKFVWA